MSASVVARLAGPPSRQPSELVAVQPGDGGCQMLLPCAPESASAARWLIESAVAVRRRPSVLRVGVRDSSCELPVLTALVFGAESGDGIVSDRHAVGGRAVRTGPRCTAVSGTR